MTTISLHTRNDWNARPPRSATPLNWRNVTQFVVHYSGAARNQTVRSIQNYCMDDKGHSDIDYNELVRGGDLYVGRGDNIGSHTLGQNSISYGVCVIGLDGDATNDDFNVVRSRYDWACQRAGRQLAKLGHRVALAHLPEHTNCPGDEIQSWIDRGMPYVDQPIGGEDIVFIAATRDGRFLASTGVTMSWISEYMYHHWKNAVHLGGVIDHGFTDDPSIYGPDVKTLCKCDQNGGTITLPTSAKLVFPEGTITLE